MWIAVAIPGPISIKIFSCYEMLKCSREISEMSILRWIMPLHVKQHHIFKKIQSAKILNSNTFALFCRYDISPFSSHALLIVRDNMTTPTK